MKVLIPGGHLTPAYATIEALKSDQAEIIFVGRASTDSHGSESKEQAEIEPLGVTFKTIQPPKLYRHPKYLNLLQIPQIFISLAQSYSILRNTNPDVILTFGGYVSLPICFVAWILRIPIVVHEQTTVMGVANRLISRIATKTAVSWPEVKRVPVKTELTGNPIRAAFFKPAKQPAWLQRNPQKPLVYITGGNQGAQVINQAVQKHLKDLLSKYQIVHQTGNARNSEDLVSLQDSAAGLPQNQKKDYTCQAWFSASEVSWLMNKADLVVSRAGANTVTELLLKETPSLFIPLPISGGNEQDLNAKEMKKVGLATILDQRNIDSLPKAIDREISTKPQLNQKQLAFLQDLHSKAAQKLAKIVISCAQPKSNNA